MSIEDPERNPSSDLWGGMRLGGKSVYPDGPIVGSNWVVSRPGASTPWAYQLASAFVLYNQPNEGMFGTYYPHEGRGVFLTDTEGWVEVRGIIQW